MRKLAWILAAIAIALTGLLFGRNLLLQKAIAAADREFAESVPPRLTDLGSVSKVVLTPVMDWHAESGKYKTEAGVSYLIEADSTTILFDLGFNAEKEDPSPLMHNLNTLGVTLDSIDMLVISHDHFDHVGGMKWMKARSFSPGNRQPALGMPKGIFTPIDMTYPGANPITTALPRKLGTGIATTGAIPAELIIGRTLEQTLVLHIEGKGLLLVVGCSHPTLPKIIERTRDVFTEPIYAIIGGLHFPVPEGRLKFLGGLLDPQRMGSGNGPFDPMTQEDVNANIRMLKEQNIQLIGVGGHDSSDEVIALFQREFGDRYREVRVGRKIEL